MRLFLTLLVVLVTFQVQSVQAMPGTTAFWCEASSMAQTRKGYCWGASINGELGNGSTADRTSPSEVLGGWNDWDVISGGSYHSCGIRGGSAYCWGSNLNGKAGTGVTGATTPQLVLGGWTDWTHISAGKQTEAGSDGHSCGIRSGIAYCWGAGQAGRLGYGGTADRTSPSVVAGGWSDWSDISAGGTSTISDGHSCGVRSGIAYCWGDGGNGRLGNGGTTQRTSPSVVSGGWSDWSKVSAGGRHTCGIRNGTAYCWGYGPNGQRGNGSSGPGDYTVPSLVSGGWTDWTTISAGLSLNLPSVNYGHTCGIRSGRAYCWGTGNVGQLGNGGTANRTSPSLVLGGWTDWLTIEAGPQHSCGTRSTGQAYCWGSGNDGRLGREGESSRTSPSTILGGWTDWSAISAGSHSCALRSGTIYCWGTGTNGQLGNGGTVDRTSPTLVLGGWTNWSIISAGSGHACGVRGGATYCWGYGLSGELGNGSTSSMSSPSLVLGGLTNWTALSAGLDHTCGIQNGSAYCWGAGGSGRLGNGGTVNRTSPSLVLGGWTDWSNISAGNIHSCGIRNGIAYCWGLGSSGEGRLGNGSNINRTSPTLVLGGWSDWTAISAGSSHSCGIRNGTVYCWGAGGSGRLGDGTTIDRTSPTLVLGGWSDWTAISAGDAHTCGIRNNTAYCWGAGNNGRLGDGFTNSTASPTLVLGGWTDWTSIDAGTAHTCGRRSTGQTYCWGDGADGDVGDTVRLTDAAGFSATPVEVVWSNIPSNTIYISAGGSHSCAITSATALSSGTC